jgi:hypothetical protein
MVQELGPDYARRRAPRKVRGVPAGLPHSPAWAPDNDHLMFSMNSQIFEWPIAAESARPVYTSPLALRQISVHWRDRRARVVGSFSKTHLDIWSLPLDPETHAATHPPSPRFGFESSSHEKWPQFSHDGTQVAFVSTRSGRSEVYVQEASGAGSPRQLTWGRPQISGHPVWSSDDMRIAFFTTAPNQPNVLHEIAVASGAAKALFSGMPIFWLDDYLYFGQMRDGVSTVTRVRMLDGEPVGEIEPLFAGSLGMPTVDGALLLYAKSIGTGVFARALAGTPASNAEERLVDDHMRAVGGIAPVAEGFYYSGWSNGAPTWFKFFDFKTGLTKPIWPAPPVTENGMTVSPDGKELLYAAPSGEGADLTLLEFEPANN